MNLQEIIKRILREEDYSPAGKEIIPNKIVIHKSDPVFRNMIMENGLVVRAGECYKTYVGYGVKCKPAIFATNSTNKRAWFDPTYNGDIWEINTEMIPDVKWYKDRHYESRSKHIVTFQNIPKEALTLKYDETGSRDTEIWNKNSPNLFRESITRILRETLETKWNEGDYDYQHGFCHYFAYDIIDRIRERFPNKKINYYLLLGEEINEDDNEVENEYLIHAYIQIDNMLLDSNGFTTKEKAQERLEEWEERQLTLIPEEYQLNVWEEESDDIPKHFFNSSFCNTKRVKQDIEKFLSHPMVKRILKYK